MIDWTRLVTAEQAAAARLADWRATRALTRLDFCLALRGAGILNDADALSAAAGEVPAAFAAVVAAMPAAQQLEARMRWSAAATIDRLNPFIAAVAAGSGLTDAQLDALFGWQG